VWCSTVNEASYDGKAQEMAVEQFSRV
jgi:hypothetical protein